MRQQQQQHQQHQRKITPQYQEYQGEGDQAMEGGVEWEEFEIENNITGNEERTVANHTAASGALRYENGHREDGEKKKKKSKLVGFRCI